MNQVGWPSPIATVFPVACEYAIRAMTYVAGFEPGTRLLARDISAHEKIPGPFLGKIFQRSYSVINSYLPKIKLQHIVFFAHPQGRLYLSGQAERLVDSRAASRRCGHVGPMLVRLTLP